MNAPERMSLASCQAAERVLGARFGTPVRISGMEPFPYSMVSRCSLEAAAGTVLSTVIIRVLREDPERSHPARLHDERTALEFLTSLDSTLAPRFLAADIAAGILITEDLGRHPSLLDVLLGDDRSAASRGLLAFARALGKLHAQTAGRAAAYEDRRARLDAVSSDAEHTSVRASIAESWRRVCDAVSQLGLPCTRGVNDDVEETVRLLSEPGAYLALSSGDASPVNCKGANGAVRFFDFEEAGFRHALIDASVVRYLYPTGGPVWRLPPEMSDSVEQVYREELVRGCPAALDNGDYEYGMAAACAAWTIQRMARLARVDAGPDRDAWPLVPPGWTDPIPTRSRRRQLVAIMETCIDSTHRSDTLQAFATWCERMVGALRARWLEAGEEIQLYPAFR